MTKLYLAYGSNLNVAQMRRRCPSARKVKTIWVDDARLVFRGVADLEFAPGERVPCGLWAITDECETALDRFEGVNAGFYEKKMIPLDDGSEALVYIMTSDGISPPSRTYYETIRRGYVDFGIDFGPLESALRHSHREQKQTAATRARRAKQIQAGQYVVQRPFEPAAAVKTDAPQIGSTTSRAPARPLDDPSINWSSAARKNSTSKGSGKSNGKKYHYNPDDFEPVQGKVNTYRARRRNQPRQNLSDWMKERGYS